MDSTPGEPSSSLRQDVDILRQELLTLESRREALLQQIEVEEKGTVDDTASFAPPSTSKEDKGQKTMHDILMAYRLTGVTIFDPSEFEDSSWSEYNVKDFPVAPKEIGIRFETFSNASYHEPYYVMITKQASTHGDQDPNRGTLRISKHTIPHWIPLREIEIKYLNRDLSTFTRIVSDHLQEYVGRRESSNQGAKDSAAAVLTASEPMD